ncbi:unnamed protein product, partial [Amoebophrya sp. A25]
AGDANASLHTISGNCVKMLSEVINVKALKERAKEEKTKRRDVVVHYDRCATVNAFPDGAAYWTLRALPATSMTTTLADLIGSLKEDTKAKGEKTNAEKNGRSPNKNKSSSGVRAERVANEVPQERMAPELDPKIASVYLALPRFTQTNKDGKKQAVGRPEWMAVINLDNEDITIDPKEKSSWRLHPEATHKSFGRVAVTANARGLEEARVQVVK